MAKVVIFSGAGLSAESGLKTFRDSGGLWEEYDVNVVCNHDSLEKNEALTLEFYDKRRRELEFKAPNFVHRKIFEIKEEHGSSVAIITQNVDNLFEKAGIDNEDVIHLHGFMPEVRCRSCEGVFDIAYKKIEEFKGGICPNCSSKLRPNIVFFGESAPMYEKLSQELSDCEFLVVIGTSGEVISVNGMAKAAKYSILNNLEESESIDDTLFSKVLYRKATAAIDEIAEKIDEYLK
ncbi:NAD-dependent deacetylase [Sulfurimonas sp. SAG-AH-194-I05]|nr:Sir2 family NAD-dependent protein deacetylase [Sulfurimonas sp. SAG-AH-194-I05]MDF1874721.1 NAD-dependent deacetylase [Sulfurimonas sp. SAG-AH-194-I05]